MLTARGWWLFLTLIGMLGVGAWGPSPLLALVALSLLAWFGWEWLLFAWRVRLVVPGLQAMREVWDDRGPVTTLWAGRAFEVRVSLQTASPFGLGYLRMADAVPNGLAMVGGESTVEGALRPDRPLRLRYRVHCPAAGLARFEGVRLQVADLQGLFYKAAFVRAPVVLRILPVLADPRAGLASTKRINELPPPGMHRLRRPGSGSELLDLRDYLPGDPPKTIAWKVSARRDKLITKEFESEVPVRCTLFVDTSNSVRLPSLRWPAGRAALKGRSLRALDRLVEIAAGVAQANAAVRDLTVLCLFDENDASFVKPDRTGPRLTQILHRLADAAALTPTAVHADPAPLLPLAYAFAQDVYPDLLSPTVNAMPWWVTWFTAFPARTRRRPNLAGWMHRLRLPVYLVGSLLVPFLCILGYLVVLAFVFVRWLPPRAIALGLLAASGASAVSAATGNLFFVLATLMGERQRRVGGWRKRMAALLSARYGHAPGGLAVLLEDDDALAALLQRFLAEHQVPYALPLYDVQGRYLFGAPSKAPVLATALVRAVTRGRDNELFVLLADLLELDDQLDLLLRAVKMALGRHHQVIVVCPWPPGVPVPEDEGGGNAVAWVEPLQPGAPTVAARLSKVTTLRFHAAYRRFRRTFGRLGVQVICAASEQPVALILERLERLRAPRRVR